LKTCEVGILNCQNLSQLIAFLGQYNVVVSFAHHRKARMQGKLPCNDFAKVAY